jgi:predicted alpha/beta hydrolase family esterase
VSFLILHGLEGNDPGHWQTWLAGRLRDAGEQVSYPDLPEPFEPKLEDWLAAIEDERAATVVCHSLACRLWLHHAARGGWRAERVLLVSPACVEVPGSTGFDPAPAAAPPEEALLVASDNDPWCPAGAKAAIGEPLGIPSVVLPGAGHINTEAGFGPWPEAEAWCRGEPAFG